MKPVAWMREWDGDVSDLGNMIFTSDESDTHDGLAWTPLYAIPEGWKRVPIEAATDELVDAPRGFILGLDMGYRTYDEMRDFMDEAGYDYSSWPEWAKTEKGHINKASIAIIIYTMMLAAAPEAP